MVREREGKRSRLMVFSLEDALFRDHHAVGVGDIVDHKRAIDAPHGIPNGVAAARFERDRVFNDSFRVRDNPAQLEPRARSQHVERRLGRLIGRMKTAKTAPGRPSLLTVPPLSCTKRNCRLRCVREPSYSCWA